MSSDSFHEKEFRLLVCGASGVGKTTILKSFCTEFSSEGKDGNGSMELCIEDQYIRIQVCEREKWSRIYPSEFDAVAVMFSTDDLDSFEYCVELIRDVELGDYIPMVVIENKMDILQKSSMEKDLVESQMKQHKLRLYRGKDENWNISTKRSPVENIRLPSREGWAEPKFRKKEKCSIM